MSDFQLSYRNLTERTPGVPCNIRYPSETHLKPKSREISFAHNLFISYPNILKFCKEHGSYTAMLCVKFQSNWTTEKDVIDERHLRWVSDGYPIYLHSTLGQYPTKSVQQCDDATWAQSSSPQNINTATLIPTHSDDIVLTFPLGNRCIPVFHLMRLCSHRMGILFAQRRVHCDVLFGNSHISVTFEGHFIMIFK